MSNTLFSNHCCYRHRMFKRSDRQWAIVCRCLRGHTGQGGSEPEETKQPSSSPETGAKETLVQYIFNYLWIETLIHGHLFIAKSIKARIKSHSMLLQQKSSFKQNAPSPGHNGSHSTSNCNRKWYQIVLLTLMSVSSSDTIASWPLFILRSY